MGPKAQGLLSDTAVGAPVTAPWSQTAEADTASAEMGAALWAATGAERPGATTPWSKTAAGPDRTVPWSQTAAVPAGSPKEAPRKVVVRPQPVEVTTAAAKEGDDGGRVEENTIADDVSPEYEVRLPVL